MGGAPAAFPARFSDQISRFYPQSSPQREAVEGFGSTPPACEPVRKAGGGEQGSALFWSVALGGVREKSPAEHRGIGVVLLRVCRKGRRAPVNEVTNG